MTAEVVTAVAVAFAVVTGANDGGALIAPGLRVPILNVPISLAVLVTSGALLKRSFDHRQRPMLGEAPL